MNGRKVATTSVQVNRDIVKGEGGKVDDKPSAKGSIDAGHSVKDNEVS